MKKKTKHKSFLNNIDDKLSALYNWGVDVPEQSRAKEINRLYKKHFYHNTRIWKDLEEWGVIPPGITSMRDIFRSLNIVYSSPQENYKIVQELYAREKKKKKRIKSQKNYLRKSGVSITGNETISELTRLKTENTLRIKLESWGFKIDRNEEFSKIEKKFIFESRKRQLEEWDIDFKDDISFHEIETLYLSEKYKRKLIDLNIKLTGSENQAEIIALYKKIKKQSRIKATKYKINQTVIPYKTTDVYIDSSENNMVSMARFEPENIEDSRKRVASSIVLRRGQAEFRNNLLNIYEKRCAITGSDAEQALEAAHIIPYKGDETNHPSNGLLLRSDIHTLFDLGLISIDTTEMVVIVSPSLLNTCYNKYVGKKIFLPKDETVKPSIEALDVHRKNSDLLN